jgi:hypothetical protein
MADAAEKKATADQLIKLRENSEPPNQSTVQAKAEAKNALVDHIRQQENIQPPHQRPGGANQLRKPQDSQPLSLLSVRAQTSSKKASANQLRKPPDSQPLSLLSVRAQTSSKKAPANQLTMPKGAKKALKENIEADQSDILSSLSDMGISQVYSIFLNILNKFSKYYA